MWRRFELIIISKEIDIIPGLFKLFDESIVNCRDHQVRQEIAIKNNTLNALPVSNIEVDIILTHSEN